MFNVLVKPMREELTNIGFTELLTPGDVDAFMSDRTGSVLLVVNSVCGCAAGNARPGVRLALEQGPRPDRLATVFAGQDPEATAHARSYFAHVPPSSPSIFLFRNGELVYSIPRQNIEGRTADQVARDLQNALSQHCAVSSSSAV